MYIDICSKHIYLYDIHGLLQGGSSLPDAESPRTLLSHALKRGSHTHGERERESACVSVREVGREEEREREDRQHLCSSACAAALEGVSARTCERVWAACHHADSTAVTGCACMLFVCMLVWLFGCNSA